MIIVNYGDQIVPGTQPVLVFPIMINQIELALDLISTIAPTIITGSVEGDLTWLGTTDEETGTPTDLTAIAPQTGAIGNMAVSPITGQLANLTLTVSKDGAAFAAGLGTLSEIGTTGFYKYIPATTETDNPPTLFSSNTGTVVVRIKPTNPRAIVNKYIFETMVNFRLKPPGFQTVNLNPGQADQIADTILQPMQTNLENFIRKAIRDLLGNQMTTKPTFRRDT